MRGWFKVHRQLLTHNLWLRSPFNDGQAWVDLIGLANHRVGYILVRGIRYKIERGQVGWSIRKLSERWQWSRGRVNRFLKWLEMEQQILPQKNNVTSVFTIVNYKNYQGSDTANATTSDTTNEPQVIPQTDTNKNDKKEKNEKKNIYTSKFLKFYNDYPRKVNKKGAFTIWRRKGLNKNSAEINLFVKKAIETKQWQDGFIPHPTTFLNQERWTDDLTAYGKQKDKVVSFKRKWQCTFCKTNNHKQDSKECYYGS